jgi:hypothetical protein
MFNGRRQPSNDGTSRMTREYQVRFCERLGVKFPGPTRQNEKSASSGLCRLPPAADMAALVHATAPKGEAMPTGAGRLGCSALRRSDGYKHTLQISPEKILEDEVQEPGFFSSLSTSLRSRVSSG